MKLRLLILMSIVLLQCANAPTGVPGPESTRTQPVKLDALTVLRVGSSTPLSVDLGPEGKPEIINPVEAADGAGGALPGGERSGVHAMKVEPTHPASSPSVGAGKQVVSYAWQASGGRISGRGSAVTFTAPDHPDTITVVVVVKEADGTTLSGATTIIVYKQWVILKADDLRYAPAGTVSPGWMRFIQYVEERKIRASLGLIGIEVERGGADFASLVHRLAANPRLEIWNHGYDHALEVPDGHGHTVSEFRGTPYEQQLDHLQRTQTLAREKCGIVLHAFGAPGNAFDSNTARALDACDDLRIWFFGAPSSDKFPLPHTIDIERPTFHPDENLFLAAYDPAPPCVTYQIHPKDWDLANFEAFSRIIDFLIAEDVTFTTPSAFERISRNMGGER